MMRTFLCIPIPWSRRRHACLFEEGHIVETEEKKRTRQGRCTRCYRGKAELAQWDDSGAPPIYEKEVSVDAEEKSDSYFEISETTEREYAVPPPPYAEHKLHRRTYFSMIKEIDEERELSKVTLAKQQEAAAKREEKRLEREALKKAKKKAKKQGSIGSSSSDGC